MSGVSRCIILLLCGKCKSYAAKQRVIGKQQGGTSHAGWALHQMPELFDGLMSTLVHGLLMHTPSSSFMSLLLSQTPLPAYSGSS